MSRAFIPGLIDSHLHATRGGRFYNLELRWDGVPTLKQALAMVPEQAKRTPKGEWVRVIGGWSSATAPPRRQLLDAGVPLGAGTDGTRVASYNPWVSLSWMVTGKTVGRTELFSKENRLTRAEALRLYAVGRAWFSGEEKGVIAPGRPAPSAGSPAGCW